MIVASLCPWRLLLLASISFSTSSGVRYSLVRRARLDFRPGTFHFSPFGGTNLRFVFVGICASYGFSLSTMYALCGMFAGRFWLHGYRTMRNANPPPLGDLL